MAFESWHVYGYGIRVDDIDTTPSKLVELGRKYPDVDKIVKEYLRAKGIGEDDDLSNLSTIIFDDLENEYGAHGKSWFLY